MNEDDQTPRAARPPTVLESLARRAPANQVTTAPRASAEILKDETPLLMRVAHLEREIGNLHEQIAALANEIDCRLRRLETTVGV